ncbi:glycosyltransferase family 4 protein [Candidatus Synechococcus calcipolaris G9]|uniref:Glycosyltransferase family 4 protein n=1 Tax=Candidatus Synechococcus calcipolaris G9 TaxID=1497997 RepID=A0ABT6F213_9SYNE|nr:glycosyltransferase family 4 protein [Candidatus Synechococcus calcipolaris]MDG2991893.1 glycosyltransferase family 4 protein [Candidatus Synechococcus calcipolaris G9]
MPLDSVQNLCIVTQYYPPDYAATGQLIEELAKYLSDQNVRVKVFAGQPGYAFSRLMAPRYESQDNLTIKRTRTARFWPRRIRGRLINGLLFCVRSLLHIIKSHRQVDVLLLTTEPPYLTFIGYLLNRLLGMRYICLLYDLYPQVAVELKVVQPHHWLVKLWNHCNHLAWQRSDSIIVLSESMRQRVIADCPDIAHKVNVIPNWANPSQIVPMAKADNWFAQDHHLVDKFTILYSGNLGRCHDVDTILAAAAKLRHKPVTFVFIGGGAKKADCVQRVEELGLENCLFLPYQDKDVLPYSLTACDLSLVSIDIGMEGLVAPSKLYGILAAGRPVLAICPPTSYLRQVLTDGQCGMAVNNGDADALVDFVDYLMENPQVGDRLGQAGRSYLLRNYTLDVAGQQYADVVKGQTNQSSLKTHFVKQNT